MKLRKLKIKNCRSIKQEEALIIDDRVTILIGANDHGKSNLLAAIQYLNDDKKIEPDDKNWDSTDGATVEIRWHFAVTEDDLKTLGQYAPKPIPEPSKSEEKSPENESTAPVEAPVEEAKEQPIFPISDNEIVFSRDSLTNIVKVESLPLPVLKSHEQEVLVMRPRVQLFDSPSGNVIDQTSLEELEQPKFEFMQGIFRLAGLWESRSSIFTQNDTTSKLLDEASSTLTRLLNDRWKQGKELKWKFKHTGNNGDHIVLEIEDPAITGRYTRPSLRSSGFRTYFLLSMIIYARTQNSPNHSNILLFDEPGTYLHPAAQLDLQRSFEVIADQAQIVYTTHSLFLVSKNYPERNRVISKTSQGTKIDQKPFSRNWKSVRESLGILLSNNFLIADKTLLVEGPSDIIYLLDSIKQLKATKAIDIDLNDISIVDAGDSQNYAAMAKLMLSEGRDIVAVVDGDKGGKSLQAQLEKICADKIGKQLFIHVLPDNKSSEDIFANLELLKKATRTAYDKLIADKVRQAKTGLNIEEEIKKITNADGITMGKTIEKVTKTWFEPLDKISKLLIAIMYEDSRENNSTVIVPAEALIELNKIKTLLKLRGEKSAQEGVFEEVQ